MSQLEADDVVLLLNAFCDLVDSRSTDNRLHLLGDLIDISVRVVAVQPPRSSSCSMPARHSAAKRFRHVPTIRRVQPSFFAISWFSRPSAAASTV